MLQYANVPEKGFKVSIETSVAHPLKFVLSDWSEGLPDIPGSDFKPRPAWIVPQHFHDLTVVLKSYTF
jgi:hypothetical protein